ncbi:MAG: 30S ribosomal protein S8 [Vampirovibrionales bacterium]|nr:30S ribosomal protein S8 [Vampirovibrionales bacterium]
MHTDPIADLLTRIRNACLAGLPLVEMPASKLKLELVKVLQHEGYIKSFELREGQAGHQTLRVILKYDVEGLPVIREIRRISRPGLRRYAGVDNIPRVLSGAGVTIVSTSKGLLTDRQARKEGVGGELLCQVS